MTWKDWAKLHANLFGLVEAKDSSMVFSWTHIFKDAGVTPQQAADASRWLAANNPPEYRTAHLKAMQSRLHAMRDGKASRAAEDAPVVSCRLCGDCGSVMVPCPRAHEAGRYRTYPVLCRCSLGLWIARDQRERYRLLKPPRDPQLTLELYEAEVGSDWRLMLADMDRRLKGLIDAAYEARRGDDARGKLACPQVFRAAMAKARGGMRDGG